MNAKGCNNMEYNRSVHAPLGIAGKSARITSEQLFELRFGFFAAEGEVGGFAAIEADEIGHEADLGIGPVAVGAVDLAVDVAGVDEEDGVGAGRLRFPFVKEPQRAGQRDGVEHVRADGDHDIDGAGLDELLADVLLGGAGVGGGVRHNETGTACVIQRGIEILNPEVVRIVRARQAEGVTATGADLGAEAFLVHLADVEGRIRTDEVELPDGAVQVLVVGVAVLDVALQPVHGQVHAGEADVSIDTLLPVDAEFRAGVPFVLLHEAGALHEHPPRTAGGIEDAAVEGLQHLDEEADDAGGREELAALLPLTHGEGAEEVFIDLPEGVALQISGDGGEGFEQVAEQEGIEDLIALRQHAGHVRIVPLDGLHGLIHRLADVRALRKLEQLRKASPGSEKQHALRMVGGGIVHL